MNSNWRCSLETPNFNFWSKSTICFSRVTFKFDRWPWQTIGHLFYVTSSFGNDFKAIGEFKLEWQSETLNYTQNQRYLSLVTLKFHGWPWKIIRHLFYAISRFEHHFIAICEFELELHSEKSQFGVKLVIFLPLWPWNLTDNLENNRAPLLCYLNLYAPLHSRLWIQTGDAVWKRPISIFGRNRRFVLAVWPSNLTDDLENQ